MTEVQQGYVYLLQSGSDAVGTQLLTRRIGVRVGDNEVMVGTDATRNRHLLIPTVGRVPEDMSSQGVTLGPRTLRIGANDVDFIDIHCRIPALGLVFERLAEDIVHRISDRAVDPAVVCAGVLDDWRALLKKAASLTHDFAVGLVGELEVFRQLASNDPVGALSIWTGPSGAIHDFTASEASIEVKASSTQDATSIMVSNLDQLDPTSCPSLYLAVYHLKEDINAPTLDERIDEIITLGVPRDAFLDLVADAGYVYESQPSAGTRFSVRGVRVWPITKSSPGLRRSDLSEAQLRGISSVRYQLSLDTFAENPLSALDYEKLLAELPQHPSNSASE